MRVLEENSVSVEEMEAVRNAIQNNDYEAFKEAVAKNSRMSDAVNEDNFAKLVEAHKLREQGKFEEAKEIMEELGLGRPRAAGFKAGFGNGRVRQERQRVQPGKNVGDLRYRTR